MKLTNTFLTCVNFNLVHLETGGCFIPSGVHTLYPLAVPTVLSLCVRPSLPQLVKMRLGVPCRVLTCVHLQCFDAVFFLQMNEKKPTWTCPVCDKPAPFELLTIDG